MLLDKNRAFLLGLYVFSSHCFGAKSIEGFLPQLTPLGVKIFGFCSAHIYHQFG